MKIRDIYKQCADTLNIDENFKKSLEEKLRQANESENKKTYQIKLEVIPEKKYILNKLIPVISCLFIIFTINTVVASLMKNNQNDNKTVETTYTTEISENTDSENSTDDISEYTETTVPITAAEQYSDSNYFYETIPENNHTSSTSVAETTAQSSDTVSAETLITENTLLYENGKYIFQLDNVTASAGGYFDVYIDYTELYQLISIAAMMQEISIDNEYISLENLEVYSDSDIQDFVNFKDKIFLLFSGAVQDNAFAGCIVKMTFYVDNSAKAGDYEIKLSGELSTDNVNDSIKYTYADGIITIR